MKKFMKFVYNNMSLVFYCTLYFLFECFKKKTTTDVHFVDMLLLSGRSPPLPVRLMTHPPKLDE